MGDKSDIDDSLHEIVRGSNGSLIDGILSIQQHEFQRSGLCSSFLTHLEVFSFGRGDCNQHILYRDWIDAREEIPFVALSYTWKESPHENPSCGDYKVENRARTDRYPSSVRNCVFDRISKYMQAQDIKYLWIDRHSIYQRVCKPDRRQFCTDEKCRRQSEKIQNSDWVYKLSRHPVALLGRPISSERELKLLHGILAQGHLSWVNGDYVLSPIHRAEARAAIELLKEITNDRWWERSWTFQENFKGGEKMHLLISYDLDHPNPDREIFGDIDGELCISSAHFSRRATQLCRAFEESDEPMGQEIHDAIEVIRATAGRYTVLVGNSAAMTPAIIADVGKRKAGHSWDVLPIIANCCDYAKRLDFPMLQSLNCSFSISLLTTCLLNGEILCEQQQLSESDIAKMTITEFIKNHIFKPRSPSQVGRKLAFNKGLRFTAPVVTRAGVRTKGHLWELGPVIEACDLPHNVKGLKLCRDSRLEPKDHDSLAQLCDKLGHQSEHTLLSSQIDNYLVRDAEGERPYQFGNDYMLLMAWEVAAAVGNGASVRLGRIRDLNKPQSESPPSYMAVFIWHGPVSGELIFTSVYSREDTDDVHLNVSVAVSLDMSQGRVPHLRVERSVFGMCFFTDVSSQDVIFPWPSVFGRIGF